MADCNLRNIQTIRKLIDLDQNQQIRDGDRDLEF
jgi:hypothetical protein